MTVRDLHWGWALLACVGAPALVRAQRPDRNEAERALSDEDVALLQSIELIWDLPMLEEWDPDEDGPRPLREDADDTRAAQDDPDPDGDTRP